MKYAVVTGTSTGFMIDATPYLKVLSELAPQLPPGARKFVSEEAHFEFMGAFAIKDLRFSRLVLTEVEYGGGLRLAISFAPNRFKHDRGLVITYEDVLEFSVRSGDERFADIERDLRNHPGDVLIDEVLPHAHGCVHEIALTVGVIRVLCADLHASWVDPAETS